MSTLMVTTDMVTTKEAKTGLRLSFQEGIAPNKILAEKFDFMEKRGIVGFEPGSANLANSVSEYQHTKFL